MVKKLIIVDVSVLARAAFYTMENLSTREDVRTGVLYGILNRILFLGGLFHSNEFMFCMDGGYKVRKDIFSGYKEKRETDRREKSEEERERDQWYYSQVNDIPAQLRQVGFHNVFHQPGYEADDWIARCVEFYQREDLDSCVIVSSDEDMFQLLGNNVSLYSPQTQKITRWRDVQEKYGLQHPSQWAEVKAIAGCSSDGVPGIPKVGNGTAAKYICGTLPSHYAAYRNIEAGRDIIERNRCLVKLPFPSTPEVSWHKPDFKPSGFKSLCLEYEFNSFLEGDVLEQWKRFFQGDPMDVEVQVKSSSTSNIHRRMKHNRSTRRNKPGLFR